VDSRGIGVQFSAEAMSRQVLKPPIRWVPEAYYPEVKRSGREAYHSPSSSVEVKNAWSCASTPHTSSWRDV
jgi:hypothetical protein